MTVAKAYKAVTILQGYSNNTFPLVLQRNNAIYVFNAAQFSMCKQTTIMS